MKISTRNVVAPSLSPPCTKIWRGWEWNGAKDLIAADRLGLIPRAGDDRIISPHGRNCGRQVGFILAPARERIWPLRQARRMIRMMNRSTRADAVPGRTRRSIDSRQG